ncbi:tetratricopeptide repeat protein [Paraburkholderia phosphatilytica]|uniref:tetratricopeptide repeat protein n=1 Tax=Paraburkholderia phosphatilytica TaxID=2282883 RepID=UPI000E470139|nr:tetratricopeptide repeat protein [Paraburkholderia phosphatilytica]
MSTSRAAPERQRLFSPAVIAILGALVALMLALAFPREKLEERLLGGANVDSLTIAYLEAWLRVDPDNADVLSELTREYLKGQRIADAERILARLARSHDPGTRQMSLAIRLSIAQRRLYGLKQDDPLRPARIVDVDALLHEAAGYSWNVDQLKALAQQARGLNDGALASQFYTQLIDADPLHANDWRIEEAKVSLGSGHYREAADAYFAAQVNAPTLGERRTLFLAALHALQGGNLLQQALDAANQHIGDLADDPETLRYLANLAIAAGRPDVAEGYVKRLLKMSMRRPHDEGPRFDYAVWHPSRHREGADTFAQPMRIPSRGVGGARWIRVAAALDRTASDARANVSAGAAASTSANATTNAAANATTTATTAAKPEDPLSPATSDEDLAYRVFLANGDVASAQRVAQRALDKAPGSMLWLARLAQVSEWNHQPDVALRSWLQIAQTRGDEQAWQQVARLAPGLDDVHALLVVTMHQSALDPDNLKLVDRVVDAYERLADPDGGLRFLEAREDGRMRRPILERYAALAERKGDDDLALRTWQTLEHEYGPNVAYAYKIATMLYARTRFDAALAAMHDAQKVAGKDDADYWRFLALLASIDQNRQAANQGYQGLMRSGQTTPDDYDMMVGYYSDSPLDAGRLAELSYRRTGQVRMLQQAVYNYQRAHAWGRLAALLDSLTPNQLVAAEKSPAFLLARSEYEHQRGELAAATADIRRAVTLAPDNGDVRAAYVWDLVDRGSDVDLRRALNRYASAAETDPALSAPYGAAYLRLGEGRAALHYLHQQAATSKHDPLWRLTWADALDLNGRADEAWRLRRQVWTELAERRRDPHAAALPDAEQDDLRGRMVGLTQLFATGDTSRAVLIEMLREDRAASRTTKLGNDTSQLGEMSEFDKLPPAKQQALRNQQATYSAIAREAAISWAQNENESDLERLWLEKQYVDRSTRPVYAQAQLAINDGDVVTLTRLLDSVPDLIPRENKVDAEALTGRYADAQTDAFDAASRLPDNQTIQPLLKEQLLRNAQSVAAAQRYVDQGPLRFNEQSVTAGMRLGDTQSLQLRLMQREQSSDGTTLPTVPKNDRLAEGVYTHEGQNDEEHVTLGQRDALDSFTEAKLEGTLNVTPSLTFAYALGYHQLATETTQLQVGGTKDFASAGLTWRFDPHWFTGGRYEYARFHGQDCGYLGSGQLFELNGGYKLRVDYPDYTVRAVVAHGQYSADGTPGTQLRQLLPVGTAFDAQSFMPQTFTQAGLLFSFGDDLTESYSKAWRPMFSAGPIRDSRAGWSGAVMLGVAGSVFGDDQMLVYGLYQGVSATNSSSVKEIGVRYRYLY